jgi:uncharacterized repeat protein (TIGR01451 family)
MDLNGSNETTRLTDDPTVGGASDPTVFSTRGALMRATKDVNGSTFNRGDAVTYTIVLNNTGNAPAADNPDNEFTDVLPPDLVLVSASATSGTVVATPGTNTVTWNGSVPASGSVTITINATVSQADSNSVINQGSAAYDADLNGSNETTVLTDDPRLGGSGARPTVFLVPPSTIPVLGVLGMIVLGLSLMGLAGAVFRRRARLG